MLNTKTEKLDKRVIRTRKLLSEAFFELMNERQFQQITVHEITDRAMINRATFYDHFADKYELFDYCIKMMFQEHLEKTISDTNRLTYNNLNDLTLSLLSFLSQFNRHCSPSERNNHLPFDKQIQSHLREVLVRWIEQCDPNRIPADTSIDLVATVTSSALFGAVTRYIRDSNDMPQREFVDQLLGLMMNGIYSIVLE